MESSLALRKTTIEGLSRGEPGSIERRVWIQGHIVSKKGPICAVDDGSDVALIEAPSPIEEEVGGYVMVIGHIPAPTEFPPKIMAHQLISLQDPNREALWWAELALAK